MPVFVAVFIFMQGASAQSRSELDTERAQQMQELIQAGKQEEAMKLYEEIMRESFSGRIRLKGSIVDTDGNLLEDVVMETVTLEFDSLRSTDLKEIKQEQPVNTTFSYACDNCAGVRLEFRKDGYYREKIEYVTYADDNPNMEIIRQDEKVVLEKRGMRVALKRYSGTLKVSPDENEVLPFSFGQRTRAVPHSRLMEIATQKQYRGDILYLELKVRQDANGRIATQEVQHPGSTYKLKKPIDAVLDFTSANGGLILYQPKSRFVRKIDREMKRAPVSGYQPTLMLAPGKYGTQYFYCRIGKRYCRGTVSPVSMNRSSNGDYASLHVSIRMNPTEGDTNLEF